MHRIDQTKFGAPDGNCMYACFASILGIRIDEVPIFGWEDGWQLKVYAFFHAYNRRMIVVDNVAPLSFLPTGYHVGVGSSDRGLPHSCVFLDGVLWHDPHPSRAGLHSVESWQLIYPTAPHP